MKREFILAGAALVVSILLSSPSFAQTTPKPAATPAPVAEQPAAPAQAEEVSLDDAILMAQTPQDRMRLLARCSGPPPRFQQTAQKAETREPARFE